MNPRVKALRELALNKKQNSRRRRIDPAALIHLPDWRILSMAERMRRRFAYMLQNEEPVVFADERIALIRTIENLPEIFTCDEKKGAEGKRIWATGNICPNYEETIKYGLLYQKRRCIDRMSSASGDEIIFLEGAVAAIDNVIQFAARYRAEAVKVGNDTVARIFGRIPEHGAETLNEALQFLRLLHFALWCEGENHLGLGRFDQYILPYWRDDIENGRLSEAEAFDLIMEFFISCNRDNDLYPGVQKGDNGQSLMLGGVDRDGNPAFNELSLACLSASGELLLIDPKINLRVDQHTDPMVFYEASLLTKKGLGFPQYCNDDIVIPGLLRLGYDLEDARNYSVAACWEFVIPRYGMEIVNIDAMNYPAIVNHCVKKLDQYQDFDALMVDVRHEMEAECDRLVHDSLNFEQLPAPFMSVLMDKCIDNARDISAGAKYNNYGIHGVGLSTAVDALTAIKLYVFDKQTLNPGELIEAVETDYVQRPELLTLLRYNTPKFGDNDEVSNAIACALTSMFADCLEGKRNKKGGRFRPGTGSAMYYLWYAENMEATAGGHRRGEPLGANYAPELFVRNKGPLSVIQSFTKPDLIRVINGGPLTMEFHESVFRNADGIEKVAKLVRSFIMMGGHQLQLNAVNKETLLDAQKHPEDHQNLIVRIWGWSAYFVQLDKQYQDHVIARQEFIV